MANSNVHLRKLLIRSDTAPRFNNIPYDNVARVSPNVEMKT